MRSVIFSHYYYQKTLEAAHHEFQRRLLGIKCHDKVSKVEVRKRTGMAKLEEIIKEEDSDASARDNDGGLQNTEPSFKLNLP